MKDANDSEGVDLDVMLRALGREIMAWRVRRNLSRKQIAELSGVSFKQVGNIERGERGQLVEAWKLANTLGVDFSSLIEQAESEARRDHQAG